MWLAIVLAGLFVAAVYVMLFALCAARGWKSDEQIRADEEVDYLNQVHRLDCPAVER